MGKHEKLSDDAKAAEVRRHLAFSGKSLDEVAEFLGKNFKAGIDIVRAEQEKPKPVRSGSVGELVVTRSSF